MLTLDLVQARLYRGILRPAYVKSNSREELERAEELIVLFNDHVGLPRHVLNARVAETPNPPKRVRLHRGLAKLLWDRTEIGTDCPVEPVELRRDLFREAAARYRQAKPGQSLRELRGEALEDMARRQGRDSEQVERWLYGDLKDEQIVQSFQSLDPEELLSRYNVALAQGILLRATELTLTLETGRTRALRELFRRIRFFRLLHRVKQLESGYQIVLDGPLSLFGSSQKRSHKYGFQMASFLPTLLHLQGWELEAKIQWKRSKRAIFQLSPAMDLRPVGRLPAQWLPAELTSLAQSLARVPGGWSVSTHSQILELGEQVVVIPDLMLEHQESGTRVFVEVFGHWRRGSIQERLRLLRRPKAPALILALGRHMAVDKDEIQDLGPHVYPFRRTPLARDLIKAAQAFVPKPAAESR